MRRLLVAASLVVGCSAKSADDTVAPVAYEGALPATIAARFASNVLFLQASVNGSTAHALLVDTGAAMTGVDPVSYAGAGLPADTASIASIGVGPLTFRDVPSVALDECGPSCGPFDVTGVLGGNVLRSFVVGFDYGAPAVVFGAASPPANATGAPVAIPFTLAGGGTGTIAGGSARVLTVPATRVLFHANVEGADRVLLLDTGASYTLLRASLFTALVADGRKTLTLESATATGTAVGAIARARTVTVESAEAASSPVASIPDAFVDNLKDEVGGPVDGLLGGSFLRAFHAQVDYAHGQITLRAYAPADALADEFVRVGLFLAAKGAGYSVGQVLAGTQAASANLAGAAVADVDGTKLMGLDPEAADRLLRGAVGATHVLHVQRSGAPSVEAVSLAVEDVLAAAP